jgi:hypothetical protein
LVIVLSAEAAGAAFAAAGPRPRVVLLGATLDDPLGGRVAAELEAMGLAVTRLVIAPAVGIEEQVRQAFVSGARAAVVADGHRTEFWVAEEGTDRVALRQELEIETSPGLESVLSLRTVEFLRVSLGLAISGPELPPPVVTRPPPPPELVPRFSVELATGVIASTGRLGAFATIAAGLRARLVGPLGLELGGYAPVGNETISTTDGQIDASVWLAGGGLVLAPRTEQRVSAEAGAGVMAVVVHAVGTPSPSAMSGSTDQAVGMAVYGRGAARFRLAPRWSLRLDVTGGSTALRAPVIRERAAALGSADTDLTAWGKAFVAGLGGLDVHF